MASAVKEVPVQETDERSNDEGSGDAGDAAAYQGGYLVEEATLTSMPHHMRILLERIPGDSLTPENLLVALLYLLLTECGFSQHTQVGGPFVGFYDSPKAQKLARSVSIEWLKQVGDFQERHFRLLDYEQDFTLITYRSGEWLCATFTGQSRGFSVILSTSRYVPFVSRHSVLRSFRNLQELSQRTKSHLIVPVRDIFMQNRTTIAPYPSLCAMPHVVLTQIRRFLSRRSQENLAKTCERLNNFLL